MHLYAGMRVRKRVCVCAFLWFVRLCVLMIFRRIALLSTCIVINMVILQSNIHINLFLFA
jgi:hypothetical protein